MCRCYFTLRFLVYLRKKLDVINISDKKRQSKEKYIITEKIMDSLSQMFNFLSLRIERLKLKIVKAGFDKEAVKGMKRPDAMTAYAKYMYLLNPHSEGEEEREGEGKSNLHLMELMREKLALRRQELRLPEKQQDMARYQIELREEEINRNKK